MFQELAKSIFLYGIGAAIIKSINLFLVPIYTRVFSPEGYGAIDLISTICAFACIVGMMQLESAVSRYYFDVKDKKKRRLFVSTALWTILVCSLFWALFISIFSKNISFLLFGDFKYRNVLFAASLIVPLSNLFAFFSVLIRFQKRPVFYLSVVTIHLLVTVIISIWFVVLREMGLIGVFFAQIIGFIFTVSFIFLKLRSLFAFSWSSDVLLTLLKYSIPLVPAAAGGWLNSYANRFVMLAYLGLADIGIFALALKIASVFKIIENAFKMAWLPFFFETLENRLDHREIFIRLNKIVTFVIFLLIAVLSLFSKEIISIVSTENYLKAAPLIGILSFSMGLVIINHTIGIGPSIVKKTIYNSGISLFSVTINIVFLLLLVPHAGLSGVAFCSVLGSFTLITGSWIISEKLYFVGFSKLFFAISFTLTIFVLSLSIFSGLDLFEKCLLAILPIILLFIVARNDLRLFLFDSAKKSIT